MTLSEFSPTPASELATVREDLRKLAERVISIGMHSRLPTEAERQRYAYIYGALLNFDQQIYYLARKESSVSGEMPAVRIEQHQTVIHPRNQH